MVRGLAEWICSLRLSEVPTAIRQAATLRVLDTMGTGVAGCTHQDVSSIDRVLRAAGGSDGQFRVSALGRGQRGVYDACLINGTAMQVLDMDELHLPSRTHPSVAVLPAVLAVAEGCGLSGAACLEAYVAGYQVECAVGSAVPLLHKRGWHPTACLGGIGAAAAVAKLTRMTAAETANALNLAAAQASGTRRVLGGSFKPVQSGRAAMQGTFAAMCAREGLVCGGDMLSDDFGFAHAATGLSASLTDGWTETWSIQQSTMKLHACGFETHASIDAILNLRRQGLRAETVDRIEITVHPDVLAIVGVVAPASPSGARVSIAHCASLALNFGEVMPEHFGPWAGRAADTANLREAIHVRADTGLPYTASRVVAQNKNGSVLEAAVETARGTPAQPLEAGDIVQKFTRLTTPVIGRDSADRLAEQLIRLDEQPDVSLLAALASEPARGEVAHA
jgi:2-methylcitrate dehydratase PrpD